MKVTEKTVALLRAHTQASSHACSDILIRDVRMTIDEPIEKGGSNTGPTPTESILGTLIGCTNVIAHKCAKKYAVDIGQLEISAVCEFDRRGVLLEEEIDLPFKKITLTITTSSEVNKAQLDQIASGVKKYCPISKVLRQAGTDLEAIWQ